MNPVQEIKEWYNAMYASKGKECMRPYEAYTVIRDYLSLEKGKNLLDVSCGTGYLLLAASEVGIIAFGVDISYEAIKIAKAVSPQSSGSVCMGENLCFKDDSFDYVTCLGSLEHFLDIEKGLQEMKHVAKHNAKFCIMVPNSKFIYWKLSKKMGTLQQDINETLLSFKQWKKLFTQNGFEVVRVYQDRWHMRSVKVFRCANPIWIIKSLIFRLAWIFLPLKWTYQFIFILRKAN